MKSLFLVLLLAGSAQALSLSLADIAPRVRDHHPALQAARLAVAEAQGRQLGAGRLSNPTLGFDWRSESRLSPVTGEFSFEQAFPLTRRLSLEKQLTAQGVAAAELEVREVERRLIAEARALAVELLALDQQQRLRQGQEELAGKLADFTRDRAAKGELSPLDAAQAKLDAQRLRLERRKLDAQRASLLGQLKPRLGLAPDAPLQLTGELPSPVLPGTAPWQQRADYRLAQTQVQAAQTAVELAKARRLQDVSAGLVGGPEQQWMRGTGGQSTGFIGFRISLPLPFWNRNQGEIAEKAATAERARLETEALGRQIAGEADTARREMQAQAELVRETRDQLLPLVLEQTKQLEQAYEAGQTDLLAVLRARDQRLQLEAAALDAVRDFHLARIRYEAATGILLP
jgi:outer membrane protein, heavy metal efflux system